MGYNLLAVDFNSILENGQAVWTLLGVQGVTTLGVIFTFIKTTVSNKKFTKMSDFAVVADQSMKMAKGEMSKLKDVIVAEVKEQIVEPLVDEIKGLKDDNQTLANLSVTLLSYVPMPLEIKNKTLGAIAQVGTVSKEVVALLEESAKQQTTLEQTTQKEADNLNDKVDNI